MNPPDDDENLVKEWRQPKEKACGGAKFFSDHEAAIADYAGQGGLTFEMGDAWTFDMQKRREPLTRPIFSTKLYGGEIMWASAQIEHFLDWLRDPEGYAALLARTEKERRLDLLYHYINDIWRTGRGQAVPAIGKRKNSFTRANFSPR